MDSAKDIYLHSKKWFCVLKEESNKYKGLICITKYEVFVGKVPNVFMRIFIDKENKFTDIMPTKLSGFDVIKEIETRTNVLGDKITLLEIGVRE